MLSGHVHAKQAAFSTPDQQLSGQGPLKQYADHLGALCIARLVGWVWVSETHHQ